jgi:hypothetical protein
MLWWLVGALVLGGVGYGAWHYFASSNGMPDSSTALLSDGSSPDSDSTSGSGDSYSSDSSSSDSGGGDSGGGSE